jgi:hypothetical protein
VKILVAIGLIFLISSSAGASVSLSNERYVEKVFGAPLFADAKDSATMDWLKKEIYRLSSRYSVSWDPDCIFRPLVRGKCPPGRPEEDGLQIDALASRYRTETEGYFDVHVNRRGRTLRNFLQMEEGLFLDLLSKEKSPGPWVANFAGDIFVSPGFPDEDFTLWVDDPLFPTISYGQIKIPGGGWVFVAGGARTLFRSSIERIFLFAESSFDGSRLDAWNYAILNGGPPVLQKLWSLSSYKGRWAYFYFTKDGETVCSPNLNCDLSNPHRRIIRVEFQQHS